MHLLKVAQISRASAVTHWNDFVNFDAHWIEPCDRVVYRPVADGTGHLLREHPLSGEIGAVMPVSQAESSIMREAWRPSRHSWV